MIFNDLAIYDINDENLESYYQKILSNELYFEKNDINSVNHNGSSLLFYAVAFNNVCFSKFLIENGIDVNIINNNGYSALSWADKSTFELIVKSENLNKQDMLLSLIGTTDSTYHNLEVFPLFLQYFEENIIALSPDDLLKIHTAIFSLRDTKTINEPLWINFCNKHDINYSIIDVFQHHILNFYNKNLYITDKLESNNEYKNKYEQINQTYQQFIVDLCIVMNQKSKVLTEDFISKATVKKDISKILKKNNIGLHYLTDVDLASATYIREIKNIEDIVNFIITDKVNNDGLLTSFLDSSYLSHSYLDKICKDYDHIFPSKKIDISPIKNLMKQYSIKSILISKSHNIDTVTAVLEKAFNMVSNIFNLSDFDMNFKPLQIDTFFRNINNEKNVVLGSFNAEFNTLWINSDEINLSDHLKDINPKKLNEFISVFTHEYTHYLQFLNEKTPQKIFEHTLKAQWDDILNTINYKAYTKNDIECIALSCARKVMKDENLVSTNESDEQIKLHLQSYFDGNELSLKKVKSLIIKDKTKINENWNHFEKLIILFKMSFKKPDIFQQEIWRNYDKVMHGSLNLSKPVYYNDDIEIHARLNEKVYFNTHSDSIIDVGYFLKKEEQDDLVLLLKPKLEKFNQLLLSHKKQFVDVHNNEQKKVKLN